jgi:hypothetical protein
MLQNHFKKAVKSEFEHAECLEGLLNHTNAHKLFFRFVFGFNINCTLNDYHILMILNITKYGQGWCGSNDYICIQEVPGF